MCDGVDAVLLLQLLMAMVPLLLLQGLEFADVTLVPRRPMGDMREDARDLPLNRPDSCSPGGPGEGLALPAAVDAASPRSGNAASSRAAAAAAVLLLKASTGSELSAGPGLLLWAIVDAAAAAMSVLVRGCCCCCCTVGPGVCAAAGPTGSSSAPERTGSMLAGAGALLPGLDTRTLHQETHGETKALDVKTA